MSDPQELASRYCEENGLWAGKNENDTIPWTNFSSCFPREAQKLLKKVRGAGVYELATYTRYMEIVGFTISLIALAISVFIFSHYRTLRNNRTRIHKNLFGAMLVQVVIRLVIYVDQAIITGVDPQNWNISIEKVPFLCKSLYVFLEYTITVVFMWMFIEGMHLHNVVTVNALRAKVSFPLYYTVGWGLPIFLTGIWAILTAEHYRNDTSASCWFGYNFASLYWILQAPRITVIVVNFVFLFNILRDLIIKLRDNENNDLQIAMKATRAALVLLPLLGLTNVLNMIEAPLESGYWKLALWSYGTHFPRSFQGFFIALIYCFMNQEVRTVIRKQYQDWREIRADDARRQRNSDIRNLGRGAESGESSRKEWIGMRAGEWCRRDSANSPLPSLRRPSQPPAPPPADRDMPHHEEESAVAQDNLTQNNQDQDKLDDRSFQRNGLEDNNGNGSCDVGEASGYGTCEADTEDSPGNHSVMSLQFLYDMECQNLGSLPI